MNSFTWRGASSLLASLITILAGAKLIVFALYTRAMLNTWYTVMDVVIRQEPLRVYGAEMPLQLVIWARVLLILVGVILILAGLLALVPRRKFSAPRRALSISSEGSAVRVPYTVVEDYVKRVVKQLDGIRSVQARVDNGKKPDRGSVRLRLRATMDLSRGSLLNLTQNLKEALEVELNRHFGYPAVEDIQVVVNKVLPREGLTFKEPDAGTEAQPQPDDERQTSFLPEYDTGPGGPVDENEQDEEQAWTTVQPGDTDDEADREETEPGTDGEKPAS